MVSPLSLILNGLESEGTQCLNYVFLKANNPRCPMQGGRDLGGEPMLDLFKGRLEIHPILKECGVSAMRVWVLVGSD